VLILEGGLRLGIDPLDPLPHLFRRAIAGLE
jgi:hypothetical protein